MYDGQVMPPILGGSPGTVDKQVGADADDGCKRSDGVFQTIMGRIGNATGKTYDSFLRWTGVTIEGTIDVSYIELHHYQVVGTDPLMKIRGVDEDNPDAPTSAAEFDADPLTTAAVDWDALFSGTWNQSPSLNSIFQELVDTYTIENDAVMLQVKDDGSANNHYNTPYDYSIDSAKAAKLHIEFSVGPTPGWNQLQYTSEPPTPNAWNQLKQDAGTGWKKLLYEGE